MLKSHASQITGYSRVNVAEWPVVVRITGIQLSPLAVMVSILLLTTASRLVHLMAFPMNPDEIWSIWQSLGSVKDVLRWTPSDWPPLYFLGLWGWKEFVGITPQALRFSSVLISLVGTACFYRATRRLWNERVALLTTLAYGAFGFHIFMSLLVRGYIPVFALTPAALWLTIRYFDHPTRRRAVFLALCLLVMFFVQYTSSFVFVFLGVYTLLVYRRSVWRWWLPLGLSVPLFGLEILRKWDVFSIRTAYDATIPLPPLPQALYRVLSLYSGTAFPIWAILFIMALLIFVYRRRLDPKALTFLLWAGSLVLLYIFQRQLGLFQDPRYIWWVIPGFIWFMGWSLSHLPRWGRAAVALALVGGLFSPGLIDAMQGADYRLAIPLDTNLRNLHSDLHIGDGVLVDKNNMCGPNEAWDYFLRLYFPNGLPYVTQPDDYRRIWYISADWLEDPAIKQTILKHHIPGLFYGPPTCLFRLYEAPPDLTGIPFDNGLRFHGAELSGIDIPNGKVFHEGDTLHLRLWWTIDQAVNLDYSIGVYVITPEGLGQADGPPQVPDAPRETSRWQTGRYYIENRDLTLPFPLRDGTYWIDLAVYQWWDGVRIAAPGQDSNKLLPLRTIIVHAW